MWRVCTALLLVMSTLLALTANSAVAVSPANEYFARTWERADRPVLEGLVARTWMWGPEAFTDAIPESYAESPGGERVVQYFDKARMEITNPTADSNSIWYVTNGLLVVELITGSLQTGNATFESRVPAEVNVAGDADDPNGPTYATFASVLDAPPLGQGTTITQRISRDGSVTDDATLVNQGVTIAVIDDVTNHSIAAPFWTFMNSAGTVYENGQLVEADLFENSYFATGRPIAEPYWSDVKVAGTVRLVLMQCFERRCLTYTPGNPDGFVVEAGNVGQHYYQWRYAASPPQPEPTPEPPTPDPTPPPGTDGETFGDGIWLVGTDIEPGIYRNTNTTELCYWARLSGTGGTLDEIVANEASRSRQIVEISPSDYAFESEDCGTWSSDLTPITDSPTGGFGDGTYFVGAEVSPGLWRNSDSSAFCYWERLSGFGGSLDEIVANNVGYELFVVEISETDVGFAASGCGTWTYNPGPITSSMTADIGGGTYIVGHDIQAGVWETEASPEGCYWARLSGFGGTIGDIIDNEFIGEDSASSAPQSVHVSTSDAGFFVGNDCGMWHYTGP